MYRIELLTVQKVEFLAEWPDPTMAQELAKHYRNECQHDEGFIGIRVRRVSEKPTPQK